MWESGEVQSSLWIQSSLSALLPASGFQRTQHSECLKTFSCISWAVVLHCHTWDGFRSALGYILFFFYLLLPLFSTKHSKMEMGRKQGLKKELKLNVFLFFVCFVLLIKSDCSLLYVIMKACCLDIYLILLMYFSSNLHSDKFHSKF